MSGPRLALVGGGDIARFHAPALVAAGFEITMVASRPESARTRQFADDHGISVVAADAAEVVDRAEEWDAALVAVPAAVTAEVLELVATPGHPVLVEKPVALSSAEVDRLAGVAAPVMVAYNRRFYAAVRAARRFVADGPPVVAHLSLPDSVAVPAAADRRGLEVYLSNSVHGLDIALHVLGALDVVHADRVGTDDGLAGIAAVMRSPRGDVVSFSAAWGAPANFSLDLARDGNRLLLQPFEMATLYEGMSVEEPTPDVPIRRYLPRPTTVVHDEGEESHYKPGFLGQARAFRSMCDGGPTDVAADLRDATRVLALAERLAGLAS